MADGPKQGAIFHGDPPIAQKSYAKHKEQGVRITADINEMWRGLAPRATCPKCGAGPEQPCLSQVENPSVHGKPLEGMHPERIAAAKKQFGRKKGQFAGRGR